MFSNSFFFISKNKKPNKKKISGKELHVEPSVSLSKALQLLKGDKVQIIFAHMTRTLLLQKQYSLGFCVHSLGRLRNGKGALKAEYKSSTKACLRKSMCKLGILSFGMGMGMGQKVIGHNANHNISLHASTYKPGIL